MNAKTQEPTKTGAGFNRHGSSGNFRTPGDLREAVCRRFGMPELDLACSTELRDQFGAKGLYVEQVDSLKMPWADNLVNGGLGWLNPPYRRIGPWAEKCALEASKGAKILLLVPAAVGSNWYHDFVHQRAMTLILKGRPAFDPEHPDWGYPKDVALCCYFGFSGFDIWDWRADVKRDEVAQ